MHTMYRIERFYVYGFTIYYSPISLLYTVCNVGSLNCYFRAVYIFFSLVRLLFYLNNK